MENYPTINNKAYGRWWSIAINEYTNLNEQRKSNMYTSHNEESASTKHIKSKDLSKDPITMKLKEIRSHSRSDQPSISNSIKEYIRKGLTMKEPIEYEASQAKVNNLAEKMNKTIQNQYKANLNTSHA